MEHKEKRKKNKKKEALNNLSLSIDQPKAHNYFSLSLNAIISELISMAEGEIMGILLM